MLFGIILLHLLHFLPKANEAKKSLEPNCLSHWMPSHSCQVSALSPDGRCKAFAEDADGYGRGEGFAALVMEPLKVMSAHQAPLALLASSAVNQDGRSSGLTVSATGCLAMPLAAQRSFPWLTATSSGY